MLPHSFLSPAPPLSVTALPFPVYNATVVILLRSRANPAGQPAGRGTQLYGGGPALSRFFSHNWKRQKCFSATRKVQKTLPRYPWARRTKASCAKELGSRTSLFSAFFLFSLFSLIHAQMIKCIPVSFAIHQDCKLGTFLWPSQAKPTGTMN